MRRGAKKAGLRHLLGKQLQSTLHTSGAFIRRLTKGSGPPEAWRTRDSLTARQGSACQLPATAACRCKSPPQAVLDFQQGTPLHLYPRFRTAFTSVSPTSLGCLPKSRDGVRAITSSSVQGPGHLCFNSPDSPEPCLEDSGATEPRAVLEWGPIPEAVFHLPPQGALWVTLRPSFSPAPPVSTLHL